jgi:deoxyribonuclease V
MIEAIRALKIKPDVCLIDGQGLAHPIRCGLATHIGVLLEIPTIGVAKSLLCGKVGPFAGNKAFILDDSEIIGAAIKTVPDKKPVFVSIGNMITLERAIEIVLHCSKTRIPEPIRMAHIRATKEKMRISY